MQLTADAQVVVVHDQDLGRLCGPQYKGMAVAQFAYHELPPLLHPGGEVARIPLLDTVLTRFPTAPVQLDLKARTPGLVPSVYALIQRHRMEDKVLWGSFTHATNSELYLTCPRIPLFTSMPRALYLLAAYYTGRLDQVRVQNPDPGLSVYLIIIIIP